MKPWPVKILQQYSDILIKVTLLLKLKIHICIITVERV